MFAIESMIIISIVMFVIGCGVGVLVSRTLVPPTQQRELESSLQDTRAELDEYQQNVAAHFVETSARIANLTDSYKGLHQHLAKGALDLTSIEVSQQVLQAAGDEKVLADDSVIETEFAQPKDWAPKEPGQMGTLSEEFGLVETKEEPGIETSSAHPASTDTKEPEA